MRRPNFPCKFGIHINTSLKEYEHFVGHLLDTGNDDGEWVEYEIPIQNMVNNRIRSSLIHSHAEDTFEIKGVTINLEKQYTQIDPENDFDDLGEPIPINIQIKRIDVIYNPEYPQLL